MDYQKPVKTNGGKKEAVNKYLSVSILPMWGFKIINNKIFTQNSTFLFY